MSKAGADSRVIGTPTDSSSEAPEATTPAAFREHGHALVDWIADYLTHVEDHPVLARVAPGATAALLPAAAPETGESWAAMLADIDRIVVPGTTHWNHPGFMAYFANTGSVPGILAELLTAALNMNPMLWRTGPAAVEVEAVALDWLRQLIGLPESYLGLTFDTASTSTFHALCAARGALADLDLTGQGLSGRPSVPRLRVYASAEAHQSVEKAAIAAGLGRSGVRRVETDEVWRMRPDALANAIDQDAADGWRAMAVVATVGTTSTTSVDPVPEIAAVCAARGVWLHVDAAYAGAAAVVPEMRWLMAGCDRADSFVVNPHKWLFSPMDVSCLYTKRLDDFRAAFSLVEAYLQTPTGEPPNPMEFSLPLGRRARGFKLWWVLRAFGRDGLVAVLRRHMLLAQELGRRVDGSTSFERTAPTPFSTVCFRATPPGLADEDELERVNEALLARVNASGKVFLSHTKLRGQTTLRAAIGHADTEMRHLDRLWALLNECLPLALEDARGTASAAAARG